MVAVDVLLLLFPTQMLAMNADAKRDLNFEREGAGRNVTSLSLSLYIMYTRIIPSVKTSFTIIKKKYTSKCIILGWG